LLGCDGRHGLGSSGFCVVWWMVELGVVGCCGVLWGVVAGKVKTEIRFFTYGDLFTNAKDLTFSFACVCWVKRPLSVFT
jgi:hypothetical protein